MTLIVSKVDGVEYDDVEPRFIVIGDKPDEFCFDRVEHRIVSKASVIAAGATAEIGTGSPALLAGVSYNGETLADFVKGLKPAAKPPTPAPTPIKAAVAGTGTTSATITFTAGPQAATGAVAISGLAVGAAAVPTTAPVATAANDTATQVAAKVATYLNGKKDSGNTVTIAATASAGVVTITEAGGGSIAAGLAAAVT